MVALCRGCISASRSVNALERKMARPGDRRMGAEVRLQVVLWGLMPLGGLTPCSELNLWVCFPGRKSLFG